MYAGGVARTLGMLGIAHVAFGVRSSFGSSGIRLSSLARKIIGLMRLIPPADGKGWFAGVASWRRSGPSMCQARPVTGKASVATSLPIFNMQFIKSNLLYLKRLQYGRDRCPENR